MTTRIRNVENKRGLSHTEMDQAHPKGAEVTFDGQTYYIGPTERMSIMNDGIGNSLVSMSAAGGQVGNAQATVDFDSGAYSTEVPGVFKV